MREEIIDVATANGPMETFICRPERGGPYPPVFFRWMHQGFGTSSPTWRGGSRPSVTS